MKKITILMLFIILLLLTSCFKANRDGYYIIYDYNDEILHYYDDLSKTSDLYDHNYFCREITKMEDNKTTYYMYSYENKNSNKEIVFLKRITLDKDIIENQCDVYQYSNNIVTHKIFDDLPEKAYSQLISTDKKEMNENQYLDLYYREEYGKYNLNLLNCDEVYIKHEIGYLIDEPITYYYFTFNENEVLYFDLFEMEINIKNCTVCIQTGDGMDGSKCIYIITGGSNGYKYEIRIRIGEHK